MSSKFDGENYTEWYYGLWGDSSFPLDQGGDVQDGLAWAVFKPDAGDVKRYPELTDAPRVVLQENSDGFVTGRTAIAYADGLAIFETGSGHYIENLGTGGIHWMSDGVDMYTDDNGNSIWPGTSEFYRAAQADLELGSADYWEAYFPDVER